MTKNEQNAVPLQGLAAYLRCEAGGVFVGSPNHETLMQWAREVDALAAANAVSESTSNQSLHVATGWAAPKDRYAVPVLFNPYTGEPRDVRDVQSDPQGILIVPLGNVEMLVANAVQPQAQGEADPNAPWLTKAHMLCTDHGVPQGNIEWRLEVLRGLFAEHPQATEPAANWATYPEKCPITRRDFFMVIEHPELGMVPTYGGPYDSYTIPHMEGKPDQQMHERELQCHRFDHDLGYWVDDESIPLRVIHDDFLPADEATDVALPAGWKMVPVEPDELWMYRAIRHYQPDLEVGGKAWNDCARELLHWHLAVLAAAPEAP